MQLNQILRSLARMPVFTAVAVFTLALGIGANTAIFSVIEGVLLKPLPYSHPDELVVLDHEAPGVNLPQVGAAPFMYFTYREDGQAFQDVGMWNTGTVSVTGIGDPEEIPALYVTDAILPMLGVPPMLGRVFTKADDSPAGAATVVLTAGYWRSKFGGDPSVIGRTLMLDSEPREIIGVLPDSFRFMDRRMSLLVPYRLDRSKVFLGQFNYKGLARLKPGVTIDQASADVERLIPISLTRFPPFPGGNVKMFEEAGFKPRIRTLKDDLVGDVRTVLWVLTGTLAVVLLIACANVANLLLVRAESRQQELAIRAALGAGSRRIARELLIESVALSLLGGLVGLGLAFGALRVLVALAPGNLPRLGDITLDIPVLVFTLALSVVAGLFFGAIPVLQSAGGRLATALRAGGRTASASRARRRMRNALVVAQVALAVVLLVSAGLMIRTFQALKNVHPGFVRPEEVQTLRLFIPDSQIKEEIAVVRMHQAIMDKMAAVPGVQSVAIASNMTMTGDGSHDPLFAEDRTYRDSEIPPIRMFKFVSPGYMKTIGGTLVAGRDFTWEDSYDMRPVAILSENLARELWGQPSAAIGKRVRPYPKSTWREVVGVVSDTRDDGVNQKATAVAYWPLLMSGFFPPRDSTDSPYQAQRGATFIVRSARAGSTPLVNELSRAVWSINPNLPVARVQTLQDIYDASLARTSFTLVMLGIAGAMALLLGITGIYSVMSYSVAQRTREIGIRIALGAQAERVRRMFVAHGLTLGGIGAAIGLAVALAMMRLMSSLLFEISPVDPVTYVSVLATLIAAAALASYVPAMRATTVNPIEALRSE